MKIEGNKVTLVAAPKKVFDFLSDFDNYRQLMPDQIVNWKSEKETCSFTVRGMADMSLKFAKKESPKLLELVPNGKTPVNFSLVVSMEPDVLNEQKTVVRVDIDADLNPMMAMFAKKPLENLAHTITNKLEKVFV